MFPATGGISAECFQVLVEFVKKCFEILEVSSAVRFQMLVQFVGTFYQIFPDTGEVSPECFQAIFSLSRSLLPWAL